jgi:flagellar biosynthesis regulator FlaF
MYMLTASLNKQQPTFQKTLILIFEMKVWSKIIEQVVSFEGQWSKTTGSGAV